MLAANIFLHYKSWSKAGYSLSWICGTVERWYDDAWMDSHPIPAFSRKFLILGPHEMWCDARSMSYSPGFSSAFITIHRVPSRMQLGWAQSIPQTKALLHIKCRLSGNTCNMLSLSIKWKWILIKWFLWWNEISKRLGIINLVGLIQHKCWYIFLEQKGFLNIY